MIVLSESSTNLNAYNPWPGLAAYDEASSAFFFGRQDEADELFRLIRLAPLTVVYGKSGLGKTSLLQAGLYPKLREQHYLPIHVRLEFSDVVKDPPLQQVMRRLREELDKEKAEYPEPCNAGSLWEYLHRKDLKIWSHDNFPLTPVLVFDQFEELFTHRSSDVGLITKVMYSLADLIENRFPPEVINEESRAARSSLDLLSQRYRIVLSFREDFLPEVQAWEQKVPSLLKNYLRLNPMSRERAIEAVTFAGKEVLNANVAPCIVDLVGKRDHDVAGMAEMVIEPVLLSLCCSRLNARRGDGAKIDQALVEQTGKDILEGFYREALDDDEVKGPPDVALFIEDYLIQGDHFRGAFPNEEALDKNLLTKKQLAALTDRHRLLRLVHHPDTTRVELIHDRLVPVVRKARDERKIKQHQAEQERLAREAQADRDKERTRNDELQRQRDSARHSLRVAKLMRNVAAGAVIMTMIAAWWNLDLQEQRTTEAQKRAVESQKRAEDAANTAVSMVTSRLAEGRLALGAGMEPLEQTMYRGLAAYRLSQSERGVSQARAASLTALHSVMESTGHLHKAITIGNLVPTPALAYSPDNKTLAVGGDDGLIRLLDAQTYRETGKLDCGQLTAESVWALAYSSGGTRLAAGYSTGDNTAKGGGLICVFDVLRHKVLRTWSSKELWNKPGDIYSVAYGETLGGEFVISAGSDKTVRFLATESGKMREFPHPEEVFAVAVNKDGDLVASGGKDRIIRLWNPDKPNARPTELKGHRASVQQVVFSPAEPNFLVSAGDDGRIMVWNITKRCLVQQSKQQPAKIINLAVSPGGLIAAASADGYVRLFRLLANATTCVTPSGKRVSATVSQAPEFAMIPDGELSGHGGFVLGAAFNREGDRLATTGQDGSIRIWTGKTPGFSLAQLELRSESSQASLWPGDVTSLAISPDGESIAVGDDKGTIYLWNSPRQSEFESVNLAPDRSWRAHNKAIRSMVFVRIGGRLAIVSGSDDGLKRWDAGSREAIDQNIADQAESIRSIAVSPDATTLATGSSDGTIRLWDVATGKRLRLFEKPTDMPGDYELSTLSFSGDGKYLAVGDNYSRVRVLDTNKPESERILQGHTDAVTTISRAETKWLLSAGSDGRILEWQQTVLEQPAVVGLKKHDEFKFRLGFRDPTPVTSIDTSRDGGLILVGGHKGLIQLWDGREHVQIAERFLGHLSSDIRAVALAPDGSFFVTADAATILVWPGPDRWADIICSKLARNMSDDQWREWVSKDIPYEIQCRGLAHEK